MKHVIILQYQDEDAATVGPFDSEAKAVAWLAARSIILEDAKLQITTLVSGDEPWKK
jgi:hypothetical protein